MPFLILLLCPEVHHNLRAPIKSQTNLRVFMDFDIGRLEMRHICLSPRSNICKFAPIYFKFMSECFNWLGRQITAIH